MSATRRKLSLLWLALSALILIAWVPVDEIADGRIWVEQDGHVIGNPYMSSHDLSVQHPEITRIIINQHGSNRKATGAYDRIYSSLDFHDRDINDQLLVIAPQFLFEDDLVEHEPEDTLFWWKNWHPIGPEWNYGMESQTGDPYPREFSTSSFAMLDSIALRAIEACPNAEVMVFVGMSAGAKMMQRYSMVSKIAEDSRLPRHFYMMISPAHHCYIGPERRVGDSWTDFDIPGADSIASCEVYDDWPFGFSNLADYPYLQDMIPDSLTARFFREDIVMVIGDEDTTLLQGGNQHSCHADLQGEHDRLERGTIWWNHNAFKNGGENPITHRFRIEPGYHHVPTIYYADSVRYYLFDYMARITEEEGFTFSMDLTVQDTPEAWNGSYAWLASMDQPEDRVADVWVELESLDSDDYYLHRVDDFLFPYDGDVSFEEPWVVVPDGFPAGPAELSVSVGIYPDLILASDSEDILFDPTSVDPIRPPRYPSRPRITSLGPNPFNNNTTVMITLPRRERVRISLHNVLGQEVAFIGDQKLSPGDHRFVIEGNGLSSGLYFIRASYEDGTSEMRKVMHLQ